MNLGSAPSSHPAANLWRRLVPRFGILLLLAASYALYAPTLGFGFVYDDIFQIVQNARLDSWHFLSSYFTHHVWAQVPQAPANLYRPFFLIWLLLNNQLFGHEAAAWHFTSLLAHLGAILLTYALARRLLKGRAAALAAAALFALHPIHVEAVAWVSAVTEPLCAVFFLAAFWFYLRYRDEGSRPVWLVASGACFAAAMLVKETAAVLPLVLLAYEWTSSQGPDRGWRRLGRRIAPYFAVLAAYLAVRTMVLHGIAHRQSAVPLRDALLSVPAVLCFYLRMLVWPSGMSPLYDLPYARHVADERFLVPVTAILALGAAVAYWIRKDRTVLPVLLTAWFLATLAPAFAVFVASPKYEGMNDRYLYLPSVAFCLFAGYLVQQVSETGRLRQFAAAFAAIAVLGACGVASRRQMRYWETNYTLFQRAAEVAPNNLTAELNLADELMKRQDYQGVLAVAGRAIQLEPTSVYAHTLCGQASLQLHEYTAAERYYVRATQLDPRQAEPFRWLAISRMALHDYDAAADALRQAIAIAPSMAGLHYTLGEALYSQGDWTAAEEQFQAELHLAPHSTMAQAALERVRAQTHHPANSTPGSRALVRQSSQVQVVSK